MENVVVADDSNSSGVTWAAVIAGAFVAAALALVLLALGTGIGLSAVSPWTGAGAAVSTIGAAALIWFILVQLIASAMGGYLAGRLRTRWVNVHTHEVYFRDTAHGFLVWAVGLVMTAAFLASAATSIAGGAARTTETAENSGRVQSRSEVGPSGYFIDALLRPGSVNSTQDSASVREEVALIFAHALREGAIPPADKSYLTQIVVARTGITEPDAEKRVDEVFAQVRQSADNARKAVAHLMYWTFLALLIGAFCASFAATIGGRQRDRVMAAVRA
jgi:hypothetical protein